MTSKMSRRLLVVLECVLFLLAGLVFIEGLTMTVEEVASTSSRLGYGLPFILMAFSLPYLVYIVHAFLYPSTKKTYVLNSKVGGIVVGFVGLAIVLLDIIGVANGTYASFVQGGVSAIFPLDTFLYGVLMVLVGAGLSCYGFKKAEHAEVVLAREESKLYRGLVKYSFGIIYVVAAMYFAADFLLIPALIDADGKNLAVVIPFLALMILPALELLAYEVWARHLEGVARAKMMLRVVPVCLLVGVILSVWGYAASLRNPTAMSESMVQFFLLDFMASKAIGPMLLYVINIVPPLVMLLRFLFAKTKKAKEQPAELDK